MGVSVDPKQWPIVVVTIWGEPEDSDYERMLAEVEKLKVDRAPFVSIVDMRKLHRVASLKQRQMMAAWTERTDQHYGELAVKRILLFRSVLLRSAFVAFQWMANRDDRNVTARSMQEALDLARAVCEEHELGEPKAPLRA